MQHREAFHKLGSRMLQSLILIDGLSSAYWEIKKKTERARGLFSQGLTCLLAVLCGIFTAVRCN
jgi:hypothetical protein